jgi:hypothetical protein
MAEWECRAPVAGIIFGPNHAFNKGIRMKIEIKHRFSGAVLFSIETESMRLAVEAAVKSRANLAGAYLAGANLARANLARANLAGANLAGANLDGAYLDGAYLAGANLDGANLARANLAGANLDGANLDFANGAALVIARTRILPEGDLIGWKKVETPTGSGIVKLRIPSEAKRSHAFGRKCRCEFADVLEAPEGAYTSNHGPRTEYKAGERVKPDSFDTNWQDECSHGIHFFITKEEAEAY